METLTTIDNEDYAFLENNSIFINIEKLWDENPRVDPFIKEFILMPEKLRIMFHNFVYYYARYKGITNIPRITYEAQEDFNYSVIQERPKKYSNITHAPIQHYWNLSPREAGQTYWVFLWSTEFLEALQTINGFWILEKEENETLRAFINSTFRRRGDIACYHLHSCIKLMIEYLAFFVSKLRS